MSKRARALFLALAVSGAGMVDVAVGGVLDDFASLVKTIFTGPAGDIRVDEGAELAHCPYGISFEHNYPMCDWTP
jgi:hypothetical protein